MIPVVAAVVRKGDKFLLCQRPKEKRHGDLWEFPGGKILQGETLDAAATRELAEELGVRAVRVGGIVGQFQDEDSEFLIHFLEVDVEGQPVANEHQAIGWFSPDEAAKLPLAPADRAFVQTMHGPGVG